MKVVVNEQKHKKNVVNSLNIDCRGCCYSFRFTIHSFPHTIFFNNIKSLLLILLHSVVPCAYAAVAVVVVYSVSKNYTQSGFSVVISKE